MQQVHKVTHASVTPPPPTLCLPSSATLSGACLISAPPCPLKYLVSLYSRLWCSGEEAAHS